MTSSDKLRLDDQLCFALYAATNAVTRTYRPLLDGIGLTYPQYLVMLVLWQDGESTINQIAKRLSLATNAISPLIDRLEANDLIRRRPSDRDRRVTYIILTEPGAALETAAAKVQQTVACETHLTPDGLAALRDELKALVDRMEPDPAAPAQDHRDAPMEQVR